MVQRRPSGFKNPPARPTVEFLHRVIQPDAQAAEENLPVDACEGKEDKPVL